MNGHSGALNLISNCVCETGPPVHGERAPRDFDYPPPLPNFATFSRRRVGKTSTWRKINHVISRGSRTRLFDHRFRKSVSVGYSDRFVRFEVGRQDTIRILTLETLARGEKIPE